MTELITGHWKFIKSNCYKASLKYKVDGDTVYGDVLEKILKTKSYKEGSNFKSWVRLIIRNTCIDQHRIAKKMNAVDLSHTYELASNESTLEDRDLLEKIIAYVKGRYTNFHVLTMLLEGYNFKEIAEVSGSLEVSNRNTLYRIRHDLIEKCRQMT